MLAEILTVLAAILCFAMIEHAMSGTGFFGHGTITPEWLCPLCWIGNLSDLLRRKK
jgi:hypothetical protein